jgi:hypothetical protein
MELFPPKSRTHLTTGIQTVMRCLAGPPRPPKESRTIRSRRIHYFMFCGDMNLTDDWLLEEVTQVRRNWQLALYATHLATGSTLWLKSIKSATISKYLLDISKFLTRFHPIDTRKTDATTKSLAPCIQSVLTEVARWEGLVDKREPYTTDMFHWQDRRCQDFPTTSQDSIHHALRDWFGVGLYGGLRLTEWAQEKSNSDISHPLLDPNGVPKAFCLADLEFRTAGNSRITLEDAFKAPEGSIERAIITFSHQKNKHHGEKRTFIRNTRTPRLCFVTLMLRIFKRFIRLVGWNHRQTPLGIYRTATGQALFITASDIVAKMHEAACAVYNLHPIRDKATLKLWSSHSLRVGACVILHALGFSGPQIKFLLRWASDCFMEYLRNLGALSTLQNAAMADIETMPNFI